MPTHWESSTRPLFVRTVLVNGTRHAILSEEDPYCPNIAANSKQSRPASPHSSRSSSASDNGNSSRENEKSTEYIEKGSKKCPKDLQSCLIKLRMVLTSQENRKAMKVEKKQVIQEGSKKKRKTCETIENEKTCDWHANEAESIQTHHSTTDVPVVRSIKYNHNDNVTVASYFNSEPRIQFCNQSQDNDIERITGHTDYSVGEYNYPFRSNISAISAMSEYDLPWNRISSDNYFTRPFYNRLSERVLQWLDLSCNKIKQSESEIKKEIKTENKRKHCKAIKTTTTGYGSSEDNSDEVRTDEDVETVLSKEYPKFSQELNRLHQIKSAIPAKPETLTTKLQESITESFTFVGRVQSGKLKDFTKAKTSPPKTLRKGYLTRQIRLEDTSEEEEELKQRKQWHVKNEIDLEHRKNNFSIKVFQQEKGYELCNRSTSIANKMTWRRDSHWPTDEEILKPQLHIFMPSLPDCEQFSDSASICSDS